MIPLKFANREDEAVIKRLASCPYCGSTIAADASSGEVVYNPDGARPGPCAHLVCFTLVLDVARIHPNGSSSIDRGHSRDWHWDCVEGLHDILVGERPGDFELGVYLWELYAGTMFGELGPPIEHRVVDARALPREQERPGSTQFVLGRDGEDLIDAFVEGGAIFSPRPAAVMRLLRRLVKYHVP